MLLKAEMTTVWLIDAHNVRGKCGYPPLADFCRAVERWAVGEAGDACLVVLAVDRGDAAEAFALSPRFVVVFSGSGDGSKDADTILVHGVDGLLRPPEETGIHLPKGASGGTT